MSNWKLDEATNRQIKVLKFFSEFPGRPINKGQANRIIARTFMVPENRLLWLKYIFLTHDESQESPDLQPFDMVALESLEIPPDWKPHASKIRVTSRFERERTLEAAVDILRDGLPFDDPVPSIEYQGRKLCFTGKFGFGSREQCQAAVAALGSVPQNSVSKETNYLIIGGQLSPTWAHESYGRKIELALTYKLEGSPLSIISEEEWAKTMKGGEEKAAREGQEPAKAGMSKSDEDGLAEARKHLEDLAFLEAKGIKAQNHEECLEKWKKQEARILEKYGGR
jgi:hypothetical protein